MAALDRVRAMSLTLPGEGDDEDAEESLFEDEEMLSLLADFLGHDSDEEDMQGGESAMQGVIVVPPVVKDPTQGLWS